jgi:hypothetical protein
VRKGEGRRGKEEGRREKEEGGRKKEEGRRRRRRKGEWRMEIAGLGGAEAGGEGGLNGAGPAGWLRESGSRLPQSKVTAAVTEGRLAGRGRVGR